MDSSENEKYGATEMNEGEEGEDGINIDPIALAMERELEEKERLKRQFKAMRPRWPPRKEGVRADVQSSMKQKIKKLATDIMELVGLSGKEIQKELMTSIAKGLARKGLNVLEPQKKLLLKTLGRPNLFKEADEVDEENSEEEVTHEEQSQEVEGEEEASIMDVDDDYKKDLLDFLYKEEKYEKEDEKSEEAEVGPEEELEAEEKEQQEEGEEELDDENLGYPWKTFQQFFRGEGEEGEEEVDPEEIRRRLDTDVGFDAEGKKSRRSTKKEPDPEEAKRQRRLKRRKICRLTLVRCGTTPRQELGYMDGWTDAGPEIGQAGRDAVETAGLALLNRGYKFDMVITSNLSVAKTTADKILYATGQDSLRRFTACELNPRHLGDLEGQTEAGVSSAWGWMMSEHWAYRGPLPIQENHPHWYRQAGGEPTGEPDHPKGETVFHVIARVGTLWNFIKHSFIHKGKRSILIIGHKDSLCGLLFHILALHPTDFSQWEPSTAIPMVVAFEKKENNFGLAAVDFITSPEETKNQVIGLCKAMMERHIDRGILDKYAFKEIKTRMDEGRRIPTIEDIYRFKRREAYTVFEATAKEVGKKERTMDALVDMFGDKLETDVAKYADLISGLEKSSTEGLNNMPVEERVEWIVKNVLGTHNKIKYLRALMKDLPQYADSGCLYKIEEIIATYKKQAKLEREWQKKQGQKTERAMKKGAKEDQPGEDMPPWKCVLESLKRGWLDNVDKPSAGLGLLN